MSDLAIAPLPKSFITNDMVELGPKDGLPEIGKYSLAMFVAPDAGAPVKAAADHIRATFEVFRETGQVLSRIGTSLAGLARLRPIHNRERPMKKPDYEEILSRLRRRLRQRSIDRQGRHG